MKQLALICITISSLSGSTALLCSYNFNSQNFIKRRSNSERFEKHNGAKEIIAAKFDNQLIEAKNSNNRNSPQSVASNCLSPINSNKPASSTKYIPGLKPKQLTEKELRTVLASLTIK